LSTTFGTIFAPGSPLLAGVSTLSSSDNTTDALASGATLLAKWADGRNAIATKGRVESVTASLADGSVSPISTIARLVVNAGNVLVRQALTVTETGSGRGTVTSSPAGINCGATCTFDYPYGTSVTLTAIPASGSTASLVGPGCSGKTTCTVTVNSATAITATFTLLRPSHTRIVKAKINKGTHTASFTFTASGKVTGFQCALRPPKTTGHERPKLRFRACTSPSIYRHLQHGRYNFEVRAVNSIGPDLKPAITGFTI
jgi:hypothetical protein